MTIVLSTIVFLLAIITATTKIMWKLEDIKTNNKLYFELLCDDIHLIKKLINLEISFSNNHRSINSEYMDESIRILEELQRG